MDDLVTLSHELTEGRMTTLLAEGCIHVLAFSTTEKRVHVEYVGDTTTHRYVTHYFVRARYHCARCGTQFYRDYKEGDFERDEPTYDRLVAL